MREIFLGRPRHWVALVAIALVLWLVGERHLHVTQFNWFVALVLVLSVGVLSLVVFGYRPGERVMREPIGDAGDRDGGGADAVSPRRPHGSG